ncbi:hypothetical protein GCM10017691_34810 [Pseudonocardia petroleophila]|uniref:DUF3710 domain-containing protein n=1 Tax=Pseudonocardia petroleophila TaxID=37331 RepID=A0A7G7MD75_9PSEU|nr:DUF3710 domain-containing protein [Pseudonocardia petroleophila]QNG50736.1 DUF3710 domain-containing protein [Pseudonocardia petroleophila]
MTAEARVGRRATSTGTFGTAAIRRRFAAQRDFGPFDAEDLDAAVGPPPGLLDFGSIRVPVPPEGSVTVEPTANGRLQAVHVALPGGRLSVSALAAPKSSGLWAELVAEIDSSLREGGARVRSFQGDWGRELHAQTGAATSVFVGVDGARWMLYGVATGPERHAVDLDAALRRMLKGTIVDRGRSPFPVRTVLPLTIPEELADADVVDDSAAGVPGPPPVAVPQGPAPDRSPHDRPPYEQPSHDRPPRERPVQGPPPSRAPFVPPGARPPAAGPVPVRTPAPVVPRRIDAPTVIRPVTAFPPAASAPAPPRPADRRPLPPVVAPPTGPAWTPDGRAAADGGRSPDGRTPDTRTPDARTPDARTPDARTPDAWTPDAWTPDRWTPEPDPVRPSAPPPADPTQALPVTPRDRPDETPVPLWAAPAGHPADGDLGPDPYAADPFAADPYAAADPRAADPLPGTRDDAATEWWPALGESLRSDPPRTDDRPDREPGPWSAADPWAAAAPRSDDRAAVREAPAAGRRRAHDDTRDDDPADLEYGAPNYGLAGTGPAYPGREPDPAPTEWWPALPPEDPAPRRSRHGSPDEPRSAGFPAPGAVEPDAVPRSGRRRRADDVPSGPESTLDLAALVRDRPGRRRSRYEPESGDLRPADRRDAEHRSAEHHSSGSRSPGHRSAEHRGDHGRDVPAAGRRARPETAEPIEGDRPASAWSGTEHERRHADGLAGRSAGFDPLSDPLTDSQVGWSSIDAHPPEHHDDGPTAGRRRAPEPDAVTDPVPAVEPAPRRRRSVDVPPDPDWTPPSTREGRPGSAPALAFLGDPGPRPGRHHRPR